MESNNIPTAGVVDSGSTLSTEEIESSKQALTKLPILGPALWLYARDPVRKYMFMGDLDWMLLPPMVLDQCRLYSQSGLPFAFITWAFVDDKVNERMLLKHPKIAPHEWNSGEHVWLVDIVAPFGKLEETVKDLQANLFPDKIINALVPISSKNGELRHKEWPPLPSS